MSPRKPFGVEEPLRKPDELFGLITPKEGGVVRVDSHTQAWRGWQLGLPMVPKKDWISRPISDKQRYFNGFFRTVGNPSG